MRGEQYFLILIDKNGVVYRTYKKPVTLREIDQRTTQYENKKELVAQIIKNTGENIDPKTIKDVQIWRRPNSKKEEYKVEKGPLCKKDAMVLAEDATASKFELLMFDKSFVRYFIKKYKGIKNFSEICNLIEAQINNKSDYFENLSYLAEKIFETYKGARNIYLSIKSYEYQQQKKRKQHDESVDALTFDDVDTNQDWFKYALEHERENLDIEDFDHHQDLSPFDEHKTR